MKTLTDYQRHGFKVFPAHGVSTVDGTHYCECGKDLCKAKTPYISWSTQSSRDVKKGEHWEIKYPNCNIGLPCGKENGFWVLDVDLGANGFQSLQAIQRQDVMPETPRAQTGGGGMHYFFKWDERAEELGISSNNGIYPGIDLKGDGGYVIAPPSKHLSGGSYNWVTDAELGILDLAPMPDWLYETLKRTLIKSSEKVHTKWKDKMDVSGKVTSGRWQYINDMLCSLRVNYGFDAKTLIEQGKFIRDSICEWPDKDPYPNHEIERIAYDIEEKFSGVKLESLDDLGNATRFVNQNRNTVRWIPFGQKRTSGLWAVWDGKRWNTEPVAGAHTRSLGTRTIEHIKNEADLVQGDSKDAEERRKEIKQFAQKCRNNHFLDQMLERAKDNNKLIRTPEKWDADLHLLNVQNGTLNISEDNLELENHNPEQFITKIAGTRYDESADCPRFKKFMSEIFQGDEDTVRSLQKAFGYSLTGSTELRNSWFLVGGGSNGKSVLLEIINRVMGDYGKKTNNKLLISDDLDQGALLAELKGIRFTFCSELDEGKPLKTAFFKDIVGGEDLETRKMYQEHFTFTPQFKLFLGTNNLPKITEDTHGIWSRIRVIPFRETFYTTDEIEDMKQAGTYTLDVKLRDETLKDYILDNELPGVLNWCLDGLRAYRREGYADSEAIREATRIYRTEEDILAEWLEDNCDTSDSTASDSAKDLRNDYIQYSGEDIHAKVFKKYMEKRGFNNKKKGGVMKYIGVKLSNTRITMSWERQSSSDPLDALTN